MSSVLEDTLVLEEIYVEGYEKVVRVKDESCGLNGIICIHNTSLGPALGGTRMYPYASFDDALNDVKRLAKGMTYKAAVTNSGVGGGKSVIIGDPKKIKTKKLLLSFARAVDRLGGKYICAEDSGTTPEDMLVVSSATPFVTGLKYEKGSGDPSPFTAWGTFRGIQSVLNKLDGEDGVSGKTIAIQGLGSVGYRLAEILFWSGAKLIVADIDPVKSLEISKRFGAKVVPVEDILKVECDVLSPCALGGTINGLSIPHLKCRAIAGCANNQLLKDSDADLLKERKILYAPDFVINAGGLINVIEELSELGYDSSNSRSKIYTIYDQLKAIYDIADKTNVSTHSAAVAFAEYRLKFGIGKRGTPLHFRHANFQLALKQ